MNIFLAILAALGLAGAAYAAYRFARASQATENTVRRVGEEGFFASLFPQTSALARQGLLAGQSNTPAYQNPLAYAGAAKDLTEAGLSIARYVQQDNAARAAAANGGGLASFDRASTGPSNLDAYRAALGPSGSSSVPYDPVLSGEVAVD